MAKLLLSLDEEYDFLLIGISCHAKDYRLCWELNKLLNFDLTRANDLEIITNNRNKKNEINSYSFYEYGDEEYYLDYYLIANRGNHAYLIPEQKKVDFFLMIKGNLSEQNLKKLLININSLSLVLTSFTINPNELKSKQNLII
ncbi:MAG: hypothetical protein CO118_08875 [Flavobacteriales bacterium CG_4_9_14_3_um_filter_32_8]|nr:MAG: hypothetical protein CO118_08875 [Flavobacteriales bacterium CG_4_9_14_3_um_filter_32_8]